MRQNDSLIGKRAEIFGAVVIALLRGGEERMQHFYRSLEHLDEFEQPLCRPVQTTAVGIGVGVGLAEILQLANVDLADQRGNILVVLITGLGLGDADLAQPRRYELDHAELRNVALDFVEPLGAETLGLLKLGHAATITTSVAG